MFYKILKVLDIIFIIAFGVVGSIYTTMIMLFLLNYFKSISDNLAFGFTMFVLLSAWMMIREDFMYIVKDICKKAK